MTQVVTNDDFASVVLQSDKPVLVDFFAPWCGPCQGLAPLLDEVSNELEGEAIVVKVDIDQSPELAQEYGVMSIPTLKVFKGGEIVGDHVGGMSKDGLKDFVVGAGK